MRGFSLGILILLSALWQIGSRTAGGVIDRSIGVEILSIRRLEASLEDIFMKEMSRKE